MQNLVPHAKRKLTGGTSQNSANQELRFYAKIMYQIHL
jgi:hypothetical protein